MKFYRPGHLPAICLLRANYQLPLPLKDGAGVRVYNSPPQARRRLSTTVQKGSSGGTVGECKQGRVSGRVK